MCTLERFKRYIAVSLMPSPDNWLKRSGYLRNVVVFFALLGVGLALFVSSIVSINVLGDRYPWLAPAYVFVTGIALYGLFVSIRCRSCGGRVAWWIARNSPLGTWLADLLTLTVCPLCGSSGGPASKHGGRD